MERPMGQRTREILDGLLSNKEGLRGGQGTGSNNIFYDFNTLTSGKNQDISYLASAKIQEGS